MQNRTLLGATGCLPPRAGVGATLSRLRDSIALTGDMAAALVMQDLRTVALMILKVRRCFGSICPEVTALWSRFPSTLPLSCNVHSMAYFADERRQCCTGWEPQP